LNKGIDDFRFDYNTFFTKHFPFAPWICDRISITLYSIAFLGLIVSVGAMTKVILTCLREKNYLINDKPSS